MRKNESPDWNFEPERYELEEGARYRLGLARRDFLRFSGAGLLVVLAARPSLTAQRGGPPQPDEIGAWLHVSEEGRVTVFTGKVEVGQNIRTSLTQAVADELYCALERVELVMGDTARTPYDRGTFGSLTTPTMAPQLRRMAGAARETLLELASERWETGTDSLRLEDGRVAEQGSDRSVSWGSLTQGKRLTRQVTADPAPSESRAGRYLGRSIPKIDGDAFVTGRHRFTSDLKLDGMLYGKMVRPAGFGAKLRSVDAEAARAMPGVVVVADGDFVGVAAPTAALARQAADAIRAEWSVPPQPSGAEIFDYLKSHPAETVGWRRRANHSAGSVEQAWAAAAHSLQSSYSVAYIAHAPLEPRAAVARWEGDALTVWTGTQRPFGVRAELAEAFKLPEEKVRVMVPDTGSGYGGKHTGDAALEAARLARAAGKPVKLVWTREEEFSWAYFRPAGLIDVRGAIDSEGLVTGWECHNYNSGASGIRTPYEVVNQKIEFHPADSPLRQGSYRALAATANHFAREVHMDELAALAGREPLRFRLHNLRDERMIGVLKAAAEKFGWGRKAAAGSGVGIACGTEKGGYVATCAEVKASPGRPVEIVRLVTAFECGAVVNPRHLESQVEGAIVQGIGGALFEAIEFEEGRITNNRFSRYRVPRFRDVPKLETVLVDRPDLPSAGAGETPIVALAPALSNAVFQAAGVRLRSLPLAPRGLRQS